MQVPTTPPSLEESDPLDYELLPTQSVEPNQFPTEMAYDSQVKENREGDVVSRQAALIAASMLMVVTWAIVLTNSPTTAGWFALHPPLQTLAVFLFTFGIITLQPTNQPKTKAAGLVRHQVAILFVGVPAILLGTIAVSYNKWLRDADHFTTWHGTTGIICMIWIVFQIVLGAGSVWFDGALFGGRAKGKALWKYHRMSGYILFPLLLFTIHLGGGWSNWGPKYSNWMVRFLTYTVAPGIILAGVYGRVRLFKMQLTR
ncbi:hypothetical protein B0H34DRAFT_694172 [Crassisporium funariophilum]|nr:hypothetical protein B0H34DRAFT_694172 [Crassisporium funariophilum]